MSSNREKRRAFPDQQDASYAQQGYDSKIPHQSQKRVKILEGCDPFNDKAVNAIDSMFHRVISIASSHIPALAKARKPQLASLNADAIDQKPQVRDTIATPAWHPITDVERDAKLKESGPSHHRSTWPALINHTPAEVKQSVPEFQAQSRTRRSPSLPPNKKMITKNNTWTPESDDSVVELLSSDEEVEEPLEDPDDVFDEESCSSEAEEFDPDADEDDEGSVDYYNDMDSIGENESIQFSENEVETSITSHKGSTSRPSFLASIITTQEQMEAYSSPAQPSGHTNRRGHVLDQTDSAPEFDQADDRSITASNQDEDFFEDNEYSDEEENYEPHTAQKLRPERMGLLPTMSATPSPSASPSPTPEPDAVILLDSDDEDAADDGPQESEGDRVDEQGEEYDEHDEDYYDDRREQSDDEAAGYRFEHEQSADEPEDEDDIVELSSGDSFGRLNSESEMLRYQLQDEEVSFPSPAQENSQSSSQFADTELEIVEAEMVDDEALEDDTIEPTEDQDQGDVYAEPIYQEDIQVTATEVRSLNSFNNAEPLLSHEQTDTTISEVCVQEEIAEDIPVTIAQDVAFVDPSQYLMEIQDLQRQLNSAEQPLMHNIGDVQLLANILENQPGSQLDITDMGHMQRLDSRVSESGLAQSLSISADEIILKENQQERREFQGISLGLEGQPIDMPNGSILLEEHDSVLQEDQSMLEASVLQEEPSILEASVLQEGSSISDARGGQVESIIQEEPALQEELAQKRDTPPQTYDDEHQNQAQQQALRTLVELELIRKRLIFSQTQAMEFLDGEPHRVDRDPAVIQEEGLQNQNAAPRALDEEAVIQIQDEPVLQNESTSQEHETHADEEATFAASMQEEVLILPRDSTALNQSAYIENMDIDLISSTVQESATLPDVTLEKEKNEPTSPLKSQLKRSSTMLLTTRDGLAFLEREEQRDASARSPTTERMRVKASSTSTMITRRAVALESDSSNAAGDTNNHKISRQGVMDLDEQDCSPSGLPSPKFLPEADFGGFRGEIGLLVKEAREFCGRPASRASSSPSALGGGNSMGNPSVSSPLMAPPPLEKGLQAADGGGAMSPIRFGSIDPRQQDRRISGDWSRDAFGESGSTASTSSTSSLRMTPTKGVVDLAEENVIQSTLKGSHALRKHVQTPTTLGSTFSHGFRSRSASLEPGNGSPRKHIADVFPFGQGPLGLNLGTPPKPPVFKAFGSAASSFSPTGHVGFEFGGSIGGASAASAAPGDQAGDKSMPLKVPSFKSQLSSQEQFHPTLVPGALSSVTEETEAVTVPGVQELETQLDVEVAVEDDNSSASSASSDEEKVDRDLQTNIDTSPSGLSSSAVLATKEATNSSSSSPALFVLSAKKKRTPAQRKARNKSRREAAKAQKQAGGGTSRDSSAV
ncbi:hypothetical protein BG004_001208 [Podila humilis]|nr:hypothetical protein BG004_001208 [Podila humilis]